MPEPISVTAPATSANLGPGFDVLALALDLTNVVTVERRPGPLSVAVEGEGAGELPEDAGNLVCRGLAEGLGELDGLGVRCRNRIPLGRGLGSSAAAVCAGLVAANALGGLRWSPDEMLARAAALEGHADNAAACIHGGVVAVAPGPRCTAVGAPDDLALVTVIPAARVATNQARGALPSEVPLADAAESIGRSVVLALALRDGDLDVLPELLSDRLHEPVRAAGVPGIEALRSLVGEGGCLGASISGSGPTTLLWARAGAAEEVAGAARAAMAALGHRAEVTPRQIAPLGVRARWGGAPEARLARAAG